MPSTKTSTSDAAAVHIRRMIFDGELTTGDRIPQDEIAATLGISRIPVREALIGLERDGLVRIELYRGAFVNPIDADTIRDHYALYGIVFGFATQLAVARTGSDATAAALDAVLDPVLDTVEGDPDPRSFTTLAREFHAVVLDASRSTRARLVSQSLSRIVPGDFFSLVPAAIAIERDGLPRIAAAIGSGDGEVAAELYRTMMVEVAETVIAVFESRGLLAEAADSSR